MARALLLAVLVGGCSPKVTEADRAAPVPPHTSAPVGAPLRAPEPSSDGAQRAAYAPPSDAGYVGTAACGQCHESINESFARHPMARSITPIDLADERKRIDGAESLIPGDQRVYAVDTDGDRLWHHERMFDDRGELIYDDAREMDFVVGSGARAFSYIFQRDDLLFMSPLNWYSRREIWDFAPGHSAEDSRRFSRRVADDCLACHTGRANPVGRNLNRFESSPFHEMAIGCENCHGPGAEHIRYHSGGDTTAADLAAGDPIIDPIDLDHQRREAVCYQCHLHAAGRVLRPGRSHFDFRPGDRLDDVWTILIADEGVGPDGRTEALSQVQQMQASQCYQQSNGRLGCISCHDPHGKPKAENRVTFYRDRCLECHEAASCDGSNIQREAVLDDCTECHMPARDTAKISHVSQTDHRILRDIYPPGLAGASSGPGNDADEEDQPTREAGDQDEELRFLWDTEERLAPWERDRALGMTLWFHGSGGGRRPPSKIADYLRPVAERFPDDGPVLTVLGAFFANYGMSARARDYYELALDDPEAYEAAVSNLMTLDYLASLWQSALGRCDEVLAIDPESPRAHALRADILAHLQRPSDAAQAAERALELDPTLIPVRQWIIRLYADQGLEEDRSRHEALLRRIQSASIPAELERAPEPDDNGT